MITCISFTDDYRCFRKGIKINFRPGVNLLVGDQGTGKSTICQILSENKVKEAKISTDKRTRTKAFDFERDSLRTKSHFEEAIELQLYSKFVSHGEAIRVIQRYLRQTTDTVSFILDEPDMALSIRTIIKLVEDLRHVANNGCQAIMAVHNPVLILAFKEVISLEECQWVTSSSFCRSCGWGI